MLTNQKALFDNLLSLTLKCLYSVRATARDIPKYFPLSIVVNIPFVLLNYDNMFILPLLYNKKFIPNISLTAYFMLK